MDDDAPHAVLDGAAGVGAGTVADVRAHSATAGEDDEPQLSTPRDGSAAGGAGGGAAGGAPQVIAAIAGCVGARGALEPRRCGGTSYWRSSPSDMLAGFDEVSEPANEEEGAGVES